MFSLSKSLIHTISLLFVVSFSVESPSKLNWITIILASQLIILLGLSFFPRNVSFFTSSFSRHVPHFLMGSFRSENCNLKQMTFTADDSDSELNKSQNGVRKTLLHAHTNTCSLSSSLSQVTFNISFLSPFPCKPYWH